MIVMGIGGVGRAVVHVVAHVVAHVVVVGVRLLKMHWVLLISVLRVMQRFMVVALAVIVVVVVGVMAICVSAATMINLSRTSSQMVRIVVVHDVSLPVGLYLSVDEIIVISVTFQRSALLAVMVHILNPHSRTTPKQSCQYPREEKRIRSSRSVSHVPSGRGCADAC